LDGRSAYSFRDKYERYMRQDPGNGLVRCRRAPGLADRTAERGCHHVSKKPERYKLDVR
jgi:hypothetical protein